MKWAMRWAGDRRFGELLEQYVMVRERREKFEEKVRGTGRGWGRGSPQDRSKIQRYQDESRVIRRDLEEYIPQYDYFDHQDCTGQWWRFYNQGESQGVKAKRVEDPYAEQDAVDKRGNLRRKEIRELEDVVLGD
jgi:hypothetical protein